jgi:hypothetical protein
MWPREVRSFFRSSGLQTRRFLERCDALGLPRRHVRRSAQRGGGSPEGEGGACLAEAPSEDQSAKAEPASPKPGGRRRVV